MAKKIGQKIPTYTVPYNLNNIPKEEFGGMFATLFSSEPWHDLMTRRNKFCRMFLQLRPGTAEANSAFKQLMEIDQKAASIMFSFVVEMSQQVAKMKASRTITLREYLSEFIKTPEQKELYDLFHMKLEIANFLADATESVITDAHDILHQIDPNVVLSEFDALKQVSKILYDYSSLRHRKEHPELMDCFTKWSDDIQDVVYLKAAQFLKENNDIRARLEAAGELKKNSNEKKEKLY